MNSTIDNILNLMLKMLHIKILYVVFFKDRTKSLFHFLYIWLLRLHRIINDIFKVSTMTNLILLANDTTVIVPINKKIIIRESK